MDNEQPSVNEMLAEVSELINTGKWRNALIEAHRNLVVSNDLAGTAQGWMQLALIAGLRRDIALRKAAAKIASECNDYTKEDEGDSYRDAAIACIKQDNTAEARTLISEARKLHNGDTNRLGALDMVEGRIFLREGNYEEASSKFALAHTTMSDSQWLTNNRLHWLFAMVMCGKDTDEILKRLLRSERNPRRMRAAKLAARFGKPATLLLIRKF